MMLIKRVFTALTVLCCLGGMLMNFPVRAEENYDSFFIIINPNQKLAEYYYHINGELHHIPADFSLTSDYDHWYASETMFTIEGNYYIRNGWPIQIKFADGTQRISEKVSEVFQNKTVIIKNIKTIDDTHPRTEYLLEDLNHNLYTYSEYQEFDYHYSMNQAELECQYTFAFCEDTPVRPVEKLDHIYYAYVVGVDDAENPEYYAISAGGQPWYFKRSELTFLKDEELHFGDILRVRNISAISTGNGNQFSFQPSATYAYRPHDMQIIGSVLSAPTAELTVTGVATYSYLKVSDGEQEYQLYLPYYLEYRGDKIKFFMPDIPDIKEVQNGDKIICALNPRGKPIMMLSFVPDGDADGNQKLDILDVIMINRVIMGKESFNSKRISHIDFNQNGVPDSADSLTMMRKIVGLE